MLILLLISIVRYCRKVAMEVRKCVAMARNNAAQLGLPRDDLVVR